MSSWTLTELVLVLAVLAVGLAAGWWWGAARGAPRAEERRARATERQDWLKASFEALQSLHQALVLELDPARAALLDPDETPARLDQLAAALRTTDLDLRARRYLLSAPLAERLGSALDGCWTTLAALKAGQRASADGLRVLEALREGLGELESTLRTELGPPVRLELEAAVLDATLEPAEDEHFAAAPVERPVRASRSVDLSALDEPEPVEEKKPRRPPTYFNLD